MLVPVNGDMSEALRQTLLDAAVDVLDDVGTAGLTLRALAARAGVSRQAPYLCFASKEALLADLAAIGLLRERARATGAMTGREDPFDRLLRVAEAHLWLRRTHPGLYALAHGGVEKSASPGLQEAAKGNFTLLRDLVAELSPGAGIEVVRVRCMTAWALTRGFGELAGMQSTPESVPGGPEQWVEQALGELVRSWAFDR